MALHEITLHLLGEDNADKMLHSLLDRAIEHTGADSGSIALLDDERRFLHIVAFRGLAQDTPDKVKLKLGEGVTGRCVLTGKARNVGDTSKDPYYVSVRPDIQSELAIPLQVGSKTFGVISVDSSRKNAFDENHEEFIQLLANYSAQIFTNQRALESLRHHAEVQSVLIEVSRQVGRYPDFRETFAAIMNILAERLGVSRGAIYLYDDITEDLTVIAHINYSDEELRRSRYSPGEGITGRVFRERKAIALPDVTLHREFLNKSGVVRTSPTAFFANPIFFKDITKGVLTIELPYVNQQRFDDHQFIAEILTSLLSQAMQIQSYIDEKSSQVLSENINLKRQLQDTFSFSNIIGSSQRMKDLFSKMHMAADTASSVLLIGESGTGKELIATALHQNSIRKEMPMIKINCAAIPADLLESELFGYVRGAFTGANEDRKGKFLEAHRGTIFLDEIGEMDARLQSKLLRVLQEKEFSPLGSNKVHKVDVRIIAATNANLDQMIADKTFREDLYYRLNVIRLEIPPLRERREDLPILVNHLVAKIARESRKSVKGVAPEAFAMLEKYDFPGNVRELENILERAVVLSSRNLLQPDDLVIPDSYKRDALPAAGVSVTPGEPLIRQEDGLTGWIRETIKTAEPGNMHAAVVGKVEKELFALLLKRNLFNKSRTAKQLGINRLTLDKKISELQIIEGFQEE